MIAQFPTGYPDEAFYSLGARHQERMDQSTSRVCQDLLGSVALHQKFAILPRHIEHLLGQIPEAFGIDLGELLENTSCFPFYAPFVKRSTQQSIEELSQNPRHLLSLSFQLGHWAPPFMRFCPECTRSDRESYREAYWHRVHQIDIVRVCPIHGARLIDSVDQKRTSGHFESAEANIGQDVATVVIDRDNPRDAMHFWLAQQAQWLLEHRDPSVDSLLLGKTYSRLLALRGYSSGGERFEKAKLNLNVSAKLDMDILTEFSFRARGHDRERTNIPWISNLARGIESTPLMHLLLIRFLGYSVDQIFEMTKNSSHFEEGPWLCLNPACKAMVINICEERGNPGSRPVGVFSCKCGFVYSRLGPDFLGKRRTQPHAILATGASWDAELQRLWQQSNLSLEWIATSLHCKPSFVMSAVSRLGLSARTQKQPKSLAEAIQEHRRMLSEFIREHPSASRNDLRCGPLAKVVKWLRRNDSDWLYDTMPASLPRRGVRPKPAEEWAILDSTLAAEVPVLRAQLLSSSTSLARVTTTRMMGMLSYGCVSLYKNLLPRTMRALAAASESVERFTVRRLAWHVERAVALGQPLKIGELLRKVHVIRSSATPNLLKAILKAERALSTIATMPIMQKLEAEDNSSQHAA